MRIIGSWGVACAVVVACSSGGNEPNDGGPDAAGVDTGIDVATDTGTTPDVITTTDGCVTTINVTVKDPSGQLPVPNVAVFVETTALPTITTGLAGACPTVPQTGVFRTSSNGTVPVDTTTSGLVNVVAQIGKWRTVAAVQATACGVTPLTIKLPGVKSSTSDVPAIAVSTGGADTLECALHRIGIDGAVTVFQGTGGAKTNTSTTSSTTLWSTAVQLDAFDAVLLSCEGAETAGAMPTNLNSYATGGGMVYAEHWQYSWFNASPFTSQNIATWTTGANFLTGTTNAVIQTNTIGTPLTQWITPLGVLVNGQLPMANTEAAHNATIGTLPTLAIAANASASVPNAALMFQWTEGTAGRIVYSDFHIGSSTGDYGTTIGATTVPANASFPSGCATESGLKPSEIVFAYTLFESLSCGM